MAMVGLEKLYYALLTTDDNETLAYGTPVYLPGVKSVKVSPKVATDKNYAENILWDQDTTLSEIEVGISLADLSNKERATLLGHDTATEGGIFAKEGDQAPYVALLHKANKSKPGTMRYQVLYKGKFELPEEEVRGKEGKTDYQNPEMKGTFQPTKKNGFWKYQIDTDDADCPTTIDVDFFKTVIIPTKKVAIP